MAVTTVPIQPIKKGSITRYWSGIVLILAAAAALAWFGTKEVKAKYQTNEQFLADNAGQSGVVTTKSGLQYKVIKGGEGASPTDNDVALIGYKGTFRDGTVFDQNPQAPMPITGVIPGFSEALKLMQRGGSYRIWIPSDLGYGPDDRTNPQTGQVMMPGNSLLVFDVEMKDYIDRATFEKQMAQMQKMQKMEGAAGQNGASSGAAGIPQPQ